MIEKDRNHFPVPTTKVKPSKWKNHQLDECSRMQPFWFWLLKPSSLSCRKSVVKPYQPCPPQLRRSWQPLDASFFSSNSEVSANNWTAIRYLNVYQTNVPAPFLRTKRKSFTTFFFAISPASCICIWLNCTSHLYTSFLRKVVSKCSINC